ncbi:MAG: universal stress protein [Ktedonobacterales bacterium]
MMKRILVPLDGSMLAERALAVAEKLARATDGSLILVQALAAPVEYGSPLIPQVVPLTIVEHERRAQAYLTRQAELPMLSGVPTQTCVLAEVPAVAILNAAATYQAELIVMTSHGRSGFSRWVFGSVAEHVARQAEIPVLVLRQHQLPFWTEGAELVEAPEAPVASEPFPELRVLVPLDGSHLAEAALEPAASCAVALVRGVEQASRVPRGSIGCHMRLVLVVRPIDEFAENIPEAVLVLNANAYLRQTAERLQQAHPDVSVSWEVATGGDVAESLLTILHGAELGAERQPAFGQTDVAPPVNPYTLLAMATHGRTGIMRWVWGSITERVVQKTQLPLLLVRPNHNSARLNA